MKQVVGVYTGSTEKLAVYPGMGHECPGVHKEKMIEWVAKYLLK